MWQVFIKFNDGYEDWTREVPGEVFDTEAEANARVDELERPSPWPSDCYFAKEIG